MNTAAMLSKLRTLEAHADLIKSQVAVLKKELEDSGASKGSARKGRKPSVSEKEIAKVLAKRQKSRLRPAPKK